MFRVLLLRTRQNAFDDFKLLIIFEYTNWIWLKLTIRIHLFDQTPQETIKVQTVYKQLHYIPNPNRGRKAVNG
ncbi:hypothetical protein PNOK_0865600 [Pyrrhoderma noxium]|uniref:Uncharacterized protein n=1 Tax=Pyrrhoderma noxium TaxID=2282107 RepID=A0A286U8A2_9AGAM|nr:hypothetical protein PNOK_0865600 [Pyrrhoderma noxium]